PDFDGTGTLGRVLFYDVSLSSDNSVSCASCHQQHLAFADDASLSIGVIGRLTSRNSIALGSLVNFGSYTSDPTTTLFWDGRVDNLHDQMIQTFSNPNEMDMELSEVLSKIKDRDYYKILSEKAFFNEDLTEENILHALSDFMNSINSFSKFDDISFKQNNLNDTLDWIGFSAQENSGKSLFQKNCVACHSQTMSQLKPFIEPLHNANNGLDLVYSDKGQGEINPSPDAIGVFKVPGLRNIELTAPYMHDGRFATLEEAIDFYSEGIQDHPNLHEFLSENGLPKKFNFTAAEKEALVSFLKTLTDPQIVTEPKWSDPF
ncbi:MAG: cytochrome c peroxidase, partial [Saprospiraceae bacterium]